MQDHEIAAHSAARHLRALASLLPRLKPEQRDAWIDGAGNYAFPLDEYVAMLGRQAERLEQTAPFTPLTDEERDLVCDWLFDELSDEKTSERLFAVTEDWTEFDWRLSYAERTEYMTEE
jgi:hypothetical protein